MAFFAPMALLLASLAWPAGLNNVPGLVDERELILPLCPVSVDIDPSGRLTGVRFVFIPVGYRSLCQAKTVKECSAAAAGLPIAAHARRSAEPDRILEVKIRGAKSALLRELSQVPGVKKLRERPDVTWVAAGTVQEYPLDKKRLVKARLRWRSFVNGEKLEFLGLAK